MFYSIPGGKGDGGGEGLGGGGGLTAGKTSKHKTHYVQTAVLLQLQRFLRVLYGNVHDKQTSIEGGIGSQQPLKKESNVRVYQWR